MAAVKWIFVALFGLAGAGALGMGFVEGKVDRKPHLAVAPPIALRPFADRAIGAGTPAAAPEKTPEAEKPAEVAKAPEKAPEAAKPAEVAKPPEPKAPPPPPAEGLLNLRASDTADVYLDGKKLGGSPLLGVKAKTGNHKVRFDCYDAAGNTITGTVQTVAVKADAETDIEFTCPAE